jgi:hypothetical protein
MWAITSDTGGDPAFAINNESMLAGFGSRIGRSLGRGPTRLVLRPDPFFADGPPDVEPPRWRLGLPAQHRERRIIATITRRGPN